MRRPLRRVVASVPTPNRLLDTLACGHVVADFDNRPRRSRRCDRCAEEHVCHSDGTEVGRMVDAHGYAHRLTRCRTCGRRLSKPLG